MIVALLNGPIIVSFLGDGMSREAYGAGTGYLSFIAYFFVFIGMKACTDGVLRGSGDVLVFTIANLVNLTIRVYAASISHPYGAWQPCGTRCPWAGLPIMPYPSAVTSQENGGTKKLYKETEGLHHKAHHLPGRPFIRRTSAMVRCSGISYAPPGSRRRQSF